LTSISDILKPKSLDELSEAVKKMHPFDFVDKFRRRSIKGMKIGFKKRLTYFLAVTYIKKFSKIYWPICGTWIVLTVCTWTWKEAQLIEDIFNWIIIGSLLPTMVSACLNLYITRRVEKHQRQQRRRVQEEANEIVNEMRRHYTNGSMI